MRTSCLHLVLACTTALLLAVSTRSVGQAVPADDPVTVQINAIPGLQYDKVRFQVKPGASVRLVFQNTDAMAHNLVITEPGERMTVVEAAFDVGPDQDFIPEISEVLYYTPILQPDSSFILTFIAPSEEGVYPYVCTYPGHGVIMYGAMYVTNGAMPPLAEDMHIPPARRKAAGDATASSGHPYPVDLPALYRTFMADSSPASIAVGLPGGQSYCFDAAFSFLRYAWHGGFVDMTEQWQGNGVSFAEPIGEIYYRNNVGFPFRIGDPDHVPEVEFKGYRLVGEGYPEFMYTINGIEVRELIKAREGGVGLVRTFKIDEIDVPLWFVTKSGTGVEYRSSTGTWTDNMLKLTPAQAQRFTITMINTTGDQ